MSEQELHPYVQWIAQEAKRPAPFGAAAKARVMEAVRAEPAPAIRHARWQWLVHRHTLALSPLGTAALAAGLVGVGVLAGILSSNRGGRESIGRRDAVPASAQVPVHDTVRVIKFVLVAPQASRVTLVGDFNRWDTNATPMVRTRTGGTWSITMPLAEGRHLYAFVVDGKQWMADPSAPLAPADGYGAPNSVVVVGGTSS